CMRWAVVSATVSFDGLNFW
nr:immunoglobulin heavy chain junction region [Macaca mulatta]MOW32863.1 immunoglobulin heavy chain junction region [Macaca mulatta]MOW33151.1 immunoglobulin heavy chain junction region [Macaca mulatta]MOW33537.1 immunoglobulin heavy chain junction region [Macaca mulatta]